MPDVETRWAEELALAVAARTGRSPIPLMPAAHRAVTEVMVEVYSDNTSRDPRTMTRPREPVMAELPCTHPGVFGYLLRIDGEPSNILWCPFCQRPWPLV